MDINDNNKMDIIEKIEIEIIDNNKMDTAFIDNCKMDCEENSSLELYLFYRLEIEPFDLKAAEIKKNIDLSKLAKHPNTLKNEDAKEKDPNNIQLPDYRNFMDIYLSEYQEEGHNIKVVYYKITNSELITATSLMEEPRKIISTAIHRHINLVNNLLNGYDKYFDFELENIIKEMSKPRYYNLSEIKIEDNKGKIFGTKLREYPIEEILQGKLFDYQRDNIIWMLDLEKNPIYDYISRDKIIFLPDGRIYNYSQNKFMTNNEREPVKFRGGLVLDNVGVGKTLQFLCLAMSKTYLTTMILVPDHLEKHWKDQFKKHFKIPLPNFINIVKYSEFKNQKIEKFDRLIVDEIHELYSNPVYKEIFELCCKTNCKYKWGISATPFPVKYSIFSIITFLTESVNYYEATERYSYFYPTYYKIFRKNTLENIVSEIILPNINEHNLVLEFNEQERILYDAEVQANSNCDDNFLRKCCCDVMINFKNKNNILSLNDFYAIVIDDFKFKYLEEKEKLDKFIKFYNNCVELYEKITKPHTILTKEEKEEIIEILKKTSKKELVENITHFNSKIQQQRIIVENKKLSYNYLYNKINESHKECPICMSKIVDGSNYDVPECMHICCSECMNYWLSSNSHCTLCRRHIDKNKIYTISNLNQAKLKYSTKVDKLLEIIKNQPDQEEKFIIYTQFDSLISKLHQTFITENIGSIKFEEPSQIIEFQNNPNKRILILSSVKNASGIDLSFVKNIIIFEPIIGDTLFLRDIEKQIIGRIYRINQINDIDVYRFIIKDTIEEKIFNEAKNSFYKK